MPEPLRTTTEILSQLVQFVQAVTIRAAHQAALRAVNLSEPVHTAAPSHTMLVVATRKNNLEILRILNEENI